MTASGGLALTTHPRRRGARHPAKVPPEVLRALLDGAETVNFMEQIALDLGLLLAIQYPELRQQAHRLRDNRLVTRMRQAGQLLLEHYGLSWVRSSVNHPSDTIRGWAAMSVGLIPDITFSNRLEFARPYADDPHFAVREWVWIGIRQHIVADPCASVEELLPYTHEDSERVRRFASEATRPIGVWSAHIPLLKAEPWQGERLLNLLRHDRSRYVQDSVANWLNDASKSAPGWTAEICGRWTKFTNPDVSARLLRRATRSLAKLGVEESGCGGAQHGCVPSRSFHQRLVVP